MPTIRRSFVPRLRRLQWIALGVAVVALGLAEAFPGENVNVVGVVFVFAIVALFIELAGWILPRGSDSSDRPRLHGPGAQGARASCSDH